MKNSNCLMYLLIVVGIASVTAQAQVGATTPFTTYEAESGSLTGGASVVSLTAPPTTEFSSPVLEASGHAYVQLTHTGQSVTWTNNTGKSITAINLRYSIPDSTSGGGINSTIDLYVNGSLRQALNVTSTQTWIYESASTYNQSTQSPGSGYFPRNFWDEVHTFITGAAVAPGGTITIKQDAANNAAFYYIDCIDLEAPPAALSQPANSLSITSYGAVANNPNFDNTTAIQNCINDAQSQGKSVWIPSGTFYVTNGQIMYANGITIQGAGPWYSAVCDASPPNKWINTILFQTISTTIQNLSINCTTTGSQVPGVAGWKDAILSFGDNWSLNNVWSQHMILTWEDGSNVTIQNCRVTNSFGDGINLNNVGNAPANNIVVQNSFFRGNGDDCIAVDDTSTSQPTMTNITIQNNTCEAMWGGKGVALYGGTNLTVQNNYIADSARYVGLGVGYFQMELSIQNALVQNNTVLRCGGNAYGQQQPALDIGTSPASWYTSQNPSLTPVYVNNAVVINNTISNSVFGGVAINSGSGVVFQNNVISSPSLLYALALNSSAVGSGVLNDNVVGGLTQGQSALFEAGVPTYNLQTPNSPVNGVVTAGSYNSMSGGVIPESCSEGGTDVGTISNGAYTEYNNVNLNGAVTLAARVASATNGGNIVVHLDSPTGTVIGTATVPPTGGWQTWTTVTSNLSGATGYHNVYLVYTGGGGSLFNVEWFAFQYAGSVIEASSYNNLSNIQTENCAEGGLDVGYINTGSYTEYNNLNLNGVSGFQARVASGGGGGYINICLDSPTGTVIGTATVPSTGGWQNWTTVNCLVGGSSGGYHNVYLVYGGQLNVEWFNFIGSMNPTEASSYNSANNLGTENCSEGGLDVGFIFNGSWSAYNNVNLNGANAFVARVASAGSGGNIVVHLDSPTGTVIGTAAVPITGGWQTWTTVNCGLTGASGYHNVYLVYTGNGGNLFNIEWFAFQAAPINTEAASYNSVSGAALETCSEGGLDAGSIFNGSYTEYNNVNLNGDVFFSARVASAGSGGNIVVHLDSVTGTVIGTATVPITGGWQTWTTVTCGLTGATGFHNIYLVYTGGGGNLFNIQWFSFQPSDNQIGAAGYSGVESGTYPSIESCSEGGSDLSNLYNGYYVYYNNINLNGVHSLAIRTASANTAPWAPGVAGVITLNLDSPTGPQIGTCNVNLTGGWQTWTTESCPITGASGTHNVYMNFKGNGGQLFSIEWFDFLQ